MRLLLDTCTFLWLATDDAKLSIRARSLFADPANQAFLSAVSAWEIALKYRAGKLPLPESPDAYIPRKRAEHGVTSLPLDERSALCEHLLPGLHNDPFDRVLVSQAIVHGMVILTPDPLIRRYAVPCEW